MHHSGRGHPLRCHCPRHSIDMLNLSLLLLFQEMKREEKEREKNWKNMNINDNENRKLIIRYGDNKQTQAPSQILLPQRQ